METVMAGKQRLIKVMINGKICWIAEDKYLNMIKKEITI